MTTSQSGSLHLGDGRHCPLAEFVVEGGRFRLVSSSKPPDFSGFVVTDEDLNAFVLRATLVPEAETPGLFEVAGQVVDRQVVEPQGG